MKKLSVILISSLVFWVNINSQTAITPSTGDGSSNNPYQVTTLENLYWAVQRTNTYFIQTADINAADTRNWNSGAGWYPYETYSFHYNGNGYVIDSLFINRSTTDYVGLIGKIFGSYIDNLVLTNVNITGQNYVGGLLGYNSTTNFTNCYVTGKINGSANNVGGLIGYSYYNSEVTNCYSIVDVTGVQYVGGLIGYANQYSTYSNCYSKGSVSSTGTYSGGLFGMCMSSVNNSYSSCDISSTSVGVGGFLGYSHIGANLTNCYSTGSVSGSGTVGGFVGFAFSLDCSNCFWDTDSSGTTTSVGSNNSGNTLPTGKTSIQMRDYTTFFNTGWDFINETKNGSNSYWGFNKEENDGYPFLTMQGYTHNPPPVLAADSITGLELTAATCNFTVYDGNQTCTQYGICWNTTGTPAFSDNYSNEGTICAFGSNTSGLTGLDTNKIYYVRAYVINTVDTGYSNVISFGSFCLPEITTLKVTGITDSTALGNISITKLGIPLLNACGVCWNTVGSPTLNDNYSNQGGVSDTGTYSVPITGLSYNTKYYVRAYAINELDTVYGIDTSFNAVHSEFTASTVIINFGDTLVGLTKQQSFYIKNTSETELNITSINFPFFQYEISPSTADISENDSAFFTLSFTPDTSKNYNGNIIFTSNAGSDTIEVIASAYYQKAIDAGNGISFDGTSNYIEMPHNSSLNPDNFTISFWAKWNGSTGTYQSIITSRSSSPQKGYIIYVSPAG
ncbi:MAG: hypothetical protein JXB17_03995, partial [Bacteroidales bacterium]|nr:hypothetical protein [Bacteroidales bacterium]